VTVPRDAPQGRRVRASRQVCTKAGKLEPSSSPPPFSPSPMTRASAGLARPHILRVRAYPLIPNVGGWNGLCGGIRRLLNGGKFTV